MATDSEGRLFTADFVLICLVSVMVFTSFYLLLPTLPMYITQRIGGQESDVGLMMGSFSFSSVLLYPFVGRELDRRGRRTILVLGLLGFALSVLLYIAATILPSLLVLRLFHGAAWAAVVSTLSTLVSDIAPVQRRGEAIGYFGISTNLAMAIGPAIAIAVIQAHDFTILFSISAVLAVLALAAGLAIRETLARPAERPAGSISRPGRSQVDIFPAAVMFSVTISYGAVMFFLPVYALNQGVENPGIFFTVFAITLIITRTFAGRLSDKLGRRAIVIPGIILVIGSAAVLGIAATLPAILIAAVLYGSGFGALHPALMALAVDRVDADNRGAAMGYFAAAFDLGIGVGGVTMGIVAQFAGLSNMYLTAGAIALIGLIAFVLADKVRKPVVDSRDTGAPSGK